MTLDTIRRRRVPIALAVLALALWLLVGIRRIDAEGGIAVLDSPLRILGPRVTGPGWHLAPPGLLRITLYPATSATFIFEAGGGGAALASREGIEVQASGTVHYKVDPERVLEVHATLGPRFERRAIRRWVLDDLRSLLAAASYSDVSGAHSEDLSQSLGASLAERFRQAGLVLLSCDVSDVHIRRRGASGAESAAGRRVAGMKVLLVGLDGADWNILDPLIEAGRLPNLGRLAREGVRTRLRTITPMLSPVIWTSIATGVQPGRHGIIDFLASTGREGERIPVTSSLRKVKAIWNILGERDLTVGVVGWWATYPAERVKGFIVSDRVAYQLFGSQAASDQPREGKVYPPDLDAQVVALTLAPEAIGIDEVARYVHMPADPLSLPPDQNKLIDDFKTLYAAGETYARIALAFGERFKPDFQAFYLEGTDTVAHLFMRYAPPPREGVDREEAQRFGRSVDDYYRHADDLVGKLVAAAGPGTTVIVCSDHGFRTGDNRPLTDPRIGYGQAADWHRKYGILILHGAPFRRHVELDEASVLAVTPTILALFGLPIADDMDGRPILDAFDPEFLKAHPVEFIPTYEGTVSAAASPQRAPSPEGGASVDPRGDQDLKEKLRSLGYLRQDTANSHNNRGMILMNQGKYDEAIGEFEQAIRSAEDLGIARLNIARAHYKKKEYAEAVAALDLHQKLHPRSKEAENLLGNIAMEQGRMQEAEDHFKRSLEYEPNFTDARNSLGILYDKTGREEDAVRQFQRVVEVDKEYAEAYNNIGVIRKKQGRIEDAVEWFKRAIGADPEFAGSYSNLALVYEQQGNLDAAEQQFREALKREAQNVAVRTNYGGLLYMKGRFEEARRELEKAVATDPSYASAHNNLGAVYGRLGRLQDEVASYRTAVSLDPNYADVHHNLGLALLKGGNVKEGESEMQRALAIDPRYAPAYLNLGRSLLGRGKAQEAADLLLEGSRQLPEDPQIQEALGETWLGLGQKERAASAFERSLALKPEQGELRRRLEELRNPDERRQETRP